MARFKGKFSAGLTQAGRFCSLALARGFALFVAVYSLASSVAAWRSAQASQNLWWLDLGFMPSPWRLLLPAASAVVLLAYAFLPRMAAWRRVLTALVCAALAAAALYNVAQFYLVWGAGKVIPGVAVPLSLLIATAFGLLAWATLALSPARVRPLDHMGTAIAFFLVVALFPLAQVAFFGTSDYRAKADAAVVFGAMVYDSGQPSSSLRDRLAEAVALYDAGLVKKLVMSGGVEPDGFDETAVMRDYAIKAGVPASAILRDPKGVSTDATVRDTVSLFADHGIRKVLAVSQGYHLPRVKLAYLAQGWDVRTVPARQLQPIWQTPLFVAREVPAFWQYWARSLARDVRGG